MAAGPSTRRDRQVVRILGLLRALAEGGRPTVYALAARFKTRRETIYRDLRALEDIGYPIVGDESGRLSRPRLASGSWRSLPAAPLTRREMAALVWAVKQAGTRQRSGARFRRPSQNSRRFPQVGRGAWPWRSTGRSVAGSAG